MPKTHSFWIIVEIDPDEEGNAIERDIIVYDNYQAAREVLTVMEKHNNNFDVYAIREKKVTISNPIHITS